MKDKQPSIWEMIPIISTIWALLFPPKSERQKILDMIEDTNKRLMRFAAGKTKNVVTPEMHARMMKLLAGQLEALNT